MNMLTSSIEPADELPWTRIALEVNAWRGACLQSFAQGEAAVSETLLFLNTAGDRGKTVQLRHLVGQRLEDLALAIGPAGAFAAEGRQAFDALTAFRIHEALRSRLAHDVAKIAIERNGKWVVVFRHVAIRSRCAERSTTAFEQSETISILSDLRRKTQRLDASLGNLRRVIEINSSK